ncbi:MAG: alpha-1,2-fucosyltransferase [Ktedonobacteraceae bacterium]
MFQYAAAKGLAMRSAVGVRADLVFLLNRLPRTGFVFREYDLDIFGLNLPKTRLSRTVVAARINPLPLLVRKLELRVREALRPGYVISERRPFTYDPTVQSNSGNAYLVGYWQSYKYFREIEASIRGDFQLRHKMSERAMDLLSQISSERESVCLNIRRADYVTIAATNRYSGVLDINYFNRAISIINGKLRKPRFFVFSDDIEWCLKNLASESSMTIVDHTYAGRKYGDYLALMMSCRHFIIPNSTFGWWAAWLGGSTDKIVIAPEAWVRDTAISTADLIPADWIRI